MARGTTLGTVLQMVKAELGYALTTNVGVSADTQLYTLIDNTQKWLSSEHDWPFLKARVDVPVVAGTRYATLPTTINFERPVYVSAFWANYWRPVEYEIGLEEYNALPSGDYRPVFPLNPIQRWSTKPFDDSQAEIWPIPTQDQVLRFEGQAVMASLKTAGSYDPTTTLDLDDLLVAFYTAAKQLAVLKKPNAQAVLAQADSRFNKLRASYSERTRPIVLGGGHDDRPKRRVVPIITVAQ